MLIRSPYQLVISSVPLAAMDDFLLLKRTEAFRPPTPVIVTTTTATGMASAREALDRGAFDIWTNPLDPEQVRVGLPLIWWHQRLCNLIAIEERAQERYRHYIATARIDEKNGVQLKRSSVIVQETLAAYTIGIDQIQRSIKLLANMAKNVKTQTRADAIKRLEKLGKS